MKLMLSPLLQRIRARRGTVQRLQDSAAETVVLVPGEVAQRPAAFSLPGQIDRVRAVQQATTLEAEIARITTGEVHHVPTRAFLLQDVWYLGGSLYKGSLRVS